MMTTLDKIAAAIWNGVGDWGDYADALLADQDEFVKDVVLPALAIAREAGVAVASDAIDKCNAGRARCDHITSTDAEAAFTATVDEIMNEVRPQRPPAPRVSTQGPWPAEA